MTRSLDIHNRVRLYAAWPALLVGGTLLALEASRMTVEGKTEVLRLDRLSDAEVWHPVEECKTRDSEIEYGKGGRVFQLHFEVDHHGGEKAYPIGWPRAHCNLRTSERNWRGWDRFEFMIQARSSRAVLPDKALVLEFGDERDELYILPIRFDKLDQWQRVPVPIATLIEKAPHLKGGIPRLRFVLYESEYKHGDLVDFYVGCFRLTRSLLCEITTLEAATPVIYTGQPFIRLRLTVTGPPADVKRGVPFTIRSKKRVVRRETLPLGRGRQVYDCDISELELSLGDYELIVFEKDNRRRKTVSFRVVEGPWKHP